MRRWARFKKGGNGGQGMGSREMMLRAKRASFPRPLSPAPYPLLAMLVLLLPLVGLSQPDLKREGDGWVRVYNGTLPACSRLRVIGHGPVTVDGGSRSFTYSIRVNVAARSEAEARRVLERLPMHIATQGDLVTL